MPRHRALRYRAAVLLGLMLAASCGRTPAGSGEDRTTEPNDLQTSPVAAPEDLAPTIIPWSGDIPVWPLTLARSALALGGDRSTYGDVALAGGMPARCLTPADSGDTYWGSFEDCEAVYLTKAGVRETALDLFEKTGVTIFEVWGSGPMKTAWAWDWNNFGSNGNSNRDLLFSSDGLIVGLQGWGPLSDAYGMALDSDAYAQIDAVVPEYWSDLDIAYYGGEDSVLGAPTSTGSGWTVVLASRLVACHACGTPFAARFALDFTREGMLETARFLDVCTYPLEEERVAGYTIKWLEREWGDVDAAAELARSLPACDPPLHTLAPSP